MARLVAAAAVALALASTADAKGYYSASYGRTYYSGYTCAPVLSRPAALTLFCARARR